jgi:TRAP-type C4-dicarboxylate transport system permease small subunit
MSRKKILTYILLAAITVSLFFVHQVGAIDIGLGDGGLASEAADQAGFNTNVTETTLAETIGLVVQAVLGFLGIIFTILVVFAGFQWMTARGDEGKVTKAQDTIRMAIVGLIIVLASYSISTFIINALSRGPQ